MELNDRKNTVPVPEHRAFTPYAFPHLKLPGRMVRSATELFRSEKDGRVSEFEVQRYREYAARPYGLVISAHTCVMPEGRTNLGQNAVWDDGFCEGEAQLAAAVHDSSFGTKTLMQLGHGGTKAKGYGGRRIFSPDTMSLSDIHETVACFGRAALRARRCGFDGVQIHGAHGYLLSEFFYPEINSRTDAYGRDAAGRFRIIREIAEEIKLTCGASFPVFLKLNCTDRTGSEDYFRDVVTALSICKDCGIEAVELSGYHSALPGIAQKPVFLETARRLHGFSPVDLMLVSGIRTRADVEAAFDAGMATVSFSRPLIADPDFITRIFTPDTPPAVCFGCGQCYKDGCCHAKGRERTTI